MTRYRRPLFGRHGPNVVAFFCGWELAGLTIPGVPTISQTVRRYPVLGVVLVLALIHHWFVEMERAFEEALEGAVFE